MANQAQITSITALDAFRSDLIVYLGQMQPVLDEVGSEIIRMKYWLENDQRQAIEAQARQRQRRMEEAQAELFNARMSRMQESSILQHLAAQKARQAVQESEQKLKFLKKWNRELENQAQPLIKQIEQLQGFLANDMMRAVMYLAQVIETLEAYAETGLPAAQPPDNSAPAV